MEISPFSFAKICFSYTEWTNVVTCEPKYNKNYLVLKAFKSEWMFYKFYRRILIKLSVGQSKARSSDTDPGCSKPGLQS